MSPARSVYGPLDARGRHELAEALGDTPETVISVHQLRRGLCRAWAAGDPTNPDAALVQGDASPDEPTGFGDSAEALWDLLTCCEGWTCVDVPTHVARPLGGIIEREMGGRLRYYGDVYHTLTRPVATFSEEHVRLLSVEDLPLLEEAPRRVRGCGFGDLRTLLTDGFVACATIDDRVVAIAHTSARTERHADVGVCTLDPFRCRGFSTACASLVAQEIQQTGQRPTWSTGEDNYASLRVARKLGFDEVARTTYVILEEHDRAGA